MRRSILSTFASIAVAAAALGGAATAHAQHGSVHIAVGPDGPTYVQPGYQYGPRPYYLAEGYGHDRDWRYDERRHDRRCGAPAWEPNRRYMPGQTVARNGHLYVARGVSRNVYNVNSPPEWTPNYWAPARC